VYSNSRNSYYGTGYPESFFDGGNSILGGIGCPNPSGQYGSFLTKINQRLAIMSDFALDFEFSHAAEEYSATVTVEHVGSGATDNLVLHLVLTESHIQQSWGGGGCMSECNFINRLMVPNQFGTALDFSGGDEVIVDLDFTFSPSWNVENCELVVFVQNTGTKEILQGTKKTMATPDFDHDAQLLAVNNVPEGNCSGTIGPEVIVKNWGADDLTSLKINYAVNNGAIQTYDWTGYLEFLEDDVVTLDQLSFDLEDENNFLVYSTEPNGVPDENTLNDTLTAEFGSAYICDFYRVTLLLRTDGFPQQTTYRVINDAGNVLYTDGPFTSPNSIHKDTFNLYNAGCYKFEMLDSAGDGLAAGAFYFLRDTEASATIVQGGEFGYTETTEITINWVGISDIKEVDGINIFPNPFATETNIHINVASTEEVIIQVYNTLGELTYDKSYGKLTQGEHTLKLTRDELTSGINLVQVRIGENSFTEKVILDK